MLFKKNKAVIASVLAGAMAIQMVAATGISASAKVDSLDYREGCDTTVDNKYGDSTYADRFMSLYDDVVTRGVQNGYMSSENTISGGLGIPYHSAEEVIVEAPDYGHETTSEAMSYLVWVAAMHDNIVQNSDDFKHEGDYSSESADLAKAWKTLEVMIPSYQPKFNTLAGQGKLSATFSEENEDVKNYPFGMNGGVTASNPIAGDFVTYGDEGLYLLHWLADVDDWYGFGGNNSSGKAEKNAIAKGTKSFVFINTFQRGESESCWETVPFACVETKQFGDSQKGLKGGIFNTDSSVADQYAYTNAPDAEDRAIQAVYDANRWGVGDSSVTAKAAKMGDETRNNMFDKYYKKIGSQSMWAETGLSGQHFLMSWYTSWGGATDGSWAWQIGASHVHEFYQNPLAAYALLTDSGLNSGMKSSKATSDFETSLVRQVELYEWLQSADGMFAGGCTNMYKGTYASYSESDHADSTFYDMLYVEHPVYADPGSNHWIGNQVWATQRLAELYYYLCQDGAKDYTLSDGSSMKEAIGKMLDKWVAWFNENTILGKATEFTSLTYDYDGVKTTNDKLPVLSSVVDDGVSFSIPSSLIWSGSPKKWDPQTGYQENTDLTCTIVGYGSGDVGCVSSLANTLIYYAAAKGVDSSAALTKGTSTEDQALYIAKELLDRVWAQGRDEIGVSIPDTNGSMKRFWETEVYIPTSAGERSLPNGDVLKNGVMFIDTRTNYRKIAKFNALEEYYNTNGNTDGFELNYHRFWHEGDLLMALGTMGMLYNDLTPGDSEDPDITTEPSTDATTDTTAEDTTDATTTDVTDTTAATDETFDSQILWGDANVDDEVNVADAVYLNKYLVDAVSLSDQGAKNANCYYDANLDSSDTLVILQLLAMTYTQEDMPIMPN